MKIKHLKIVEQIIIITLIGVLFPSVISWLIINNISQHSIRHQLGNSAQMLAKIIENNISSIIQKDDSRLNEISIGLGHLSGDYQQQLYLKILQLIPIFLKTLKLFIRVKLLISIQKVRLLLIQIPINYG